MHADCLPHQVRPYRFEGAWPDKYFRALTSLEQAVLYWQVSSGGAKLSVPRPKDDVSVWDARDHSVTLIASLIILIASLIRLIASLIRSGTLAITLSRCRGAPCGRCSGRRASRHPSTECH